ncbi:hypothetical protein [Arthrobacter sp. ok362]|uniref:hypothetical protein n=1 Tax=Arthrobacter sp. ok362 TaxID=1761745 RepID=UPI00088ECE16|nr:hypothetical protein [Arthrobacter sp. ok362]SDK59380.1 hypothetical protein SAMN04487913_10246 [Arthrobacter sp. ok362]
MTDTTAVLDTRLQPLAEQLKKSFTGNGQVSKDWGKPSVNTDASQLAASLLSAYQQAALVNPGIAIRPKGVVPALQLQDPANKDLWDDALKLVTTVGPPLINWLSKDYKPETPTLGDIIKQVPESRRNDKDWTDFASQFVLIAAQATVQALSGAKDFTDPKNSITFPDLPPGLTEAERKNWLSDLGDWTVHSLPSIIPAVLPLIL